MFLAAFLVGCAVSTVEKETAFQLEALHINMVADQLTEEMANTLGSQEGVGMASMPGHEGMVHQ